MRWFRRLGSFLPCVAFLAPAWGVQTAYVRLPSDATDGGTLALKVSWPDTATEDRFEDGPPVVVMVLGGTSSGGFRTWNDPIAAEGFVVVEFLFPGGSDEGQSSDGIYDYRGPKSVMAARDTWLFALGLLVDDTGRTIHDVVGRTVLTQVMGVSAVSNGGGLTAATLNLYQDQLTGVRMLSLWENGFSQPSQTNELGDLDRDCDETIDGDGNGFFNDDGKNPRYVPATDYRYDDPETDLSHLAWDPSIKTNFRDESGRFLPTRRDGALFFDGNGNGTYDYRPGATLCSDTDNDGATELNEDWLVGTRKIFTDAGEPRAHYAQKTTAYLAANPDIFPNGRPDWVATEQQAAEYWQSRAGNLHLHNLASLSSSLRVIHSYAEVYHSHTIEDLADARAVLDGCKASGLWIRLQPDAVYLAEVMGSAPPGYPDNDANVDVPMGQMLSTAATDGTGAVDLTTAAFMELADRTYYGGWQKQLETLLAAAGVPADTAEALRFVDTDTLSWNEDATNLFFDVARGDVAALRETGASIDLGALTCIEEDSIDTASITSETPASGAAFFYVVRPNNLNGHYGTGSSGKSRTPSSGDCVH